MTFSTAGGGRIAVLGALEQERLDVFGQFLVGHVGKFLGGLVGRLDAGPVFLAVELADGFLALGVLVEHQVRVPVGLGLGAGVDAADRRRRVAGRADAAVVQTSTLPVGVVGLGCERGAQQRDQGGGGQVLRGFHDDSLVFEGMLDGVIRRLLPSR